MEKILFFLEESIKTNFVESRSLAIDINNILKKMYQIENNNLLYSNYINHMLLLCHVYNNETYIGYYSNILKKNTFFNEINIYTLTNYKINKLSPEIFENNNLTKNEKQQLYERYQEEKHVLIECYNKYETGKLFDIYNDSFYQQIYKKLYPESNSKINNITSFVDYDYICNKKCKKIYVCDTRYVIYGVINSINIITNKRYETKNYFMKIYPIEYKIIEYSTLKNAFNIKKEIFLNK